MSFLITVAAPAAPAVQHQQHMVNHDQPCVQSKNAIDPTEQRQSRHKRHAMTMIDSPYGRQRDPYLGCRCNCLQFSAERRYWLEAWLLHDRNLSPLRAKTSITQILAGADNPLTHEHA